MVSARGAPAKRFAHVEPSATHGSEFYPLGHRRDHHGQHLATDNVLRNDRFPLWLVERLKEVRELVPNASIVLAVPSPKTTIALSDEALQLAADLGVTLRPIALP